MARMLLDPPNFLVLDEPTNHLDLATKEMLVEALHDFETDFNATTSSPERCGLRKSNFMALRFFGSSMRSCFSSIFTRLCTCAAFAACALKRSMKRCSLASLACWRAYAAS